MMARSKLGYAEPIPKTPRLIDNGYLRWLRKQPCACGCGRPAPSDAAHIRVGSILMKKRGTGAGEKPHDFWAVPLNRSCHMRQHAHGDELGWWFMHKRNPFKLAISYYREYGGEGGKPRPSKMAKPVKARKPRAARQKIKSRAGWWPHRRFPASKGGWYE
jgi:hypothetical protein